jgi:hypothetical protein
MLGEKTFIFMATIKGYFLEKTCKDLTQKIIKKIGMTPAYESQSFYFPYCGKGGNGLTYFQPITESFICWDVWPQWEGAYLIVCSCKEYNQSDIIDLLKKEGIVITEFLINSLNL